MANISGLDGQHRQLSQGAADLFAAIRDEAQISVNGETGTDGTRAGAERLADVRRRLYYDDRIPDKVSDRLAARLTAAIGDRVSKPPPVPKKSDEFERPPGAHMVYR